MRFDAIVVGAGPAGSTTARYAARRGLKVLLLDKRKEIGVPVQCGEYVATNEEVRAIFPTVPDLEDLMQASYRARQVDTPVIRIFTPRGRRYDVPFRGFTVARDKMDQAIADQAVREGAELITGTSVTRVRGEDVTTSRGAFQGGVVVGADGPRSTVARQVGLPWPVSAPAMSTTAVGAFDTSTDLYFGNLAPGGYAWVIPKGDCANVGLGTWQHFHGNLRRLFDAFMERHDLQPGKATGGFVPVLGPVGMTVRGNALLVGDAAGHVMATNGGGINVAMICGRIAGDVTADHVLAQVPLTDYERRWRAAVGGPLARGARTKLLADRFFGSDRLLEAAMLLLGRRRMARAIRCERLFFGSKSAA
jgi:digeranylgeranylglycerophospholipid reductase